MLPSAVKEPSVPEDPQPVTRLLREWRQGRSGAQAELFPLVYAELRRLAEQHMRGERPGHTLQATALVHEAYLRLVDADVAGESRGQFFALAARAMRNLLVDHARGRQAEKRGGGQKRLTLDEGLVVSPEPSAELLDLDRALARLEELDPRKCRAIELHFFGGLRHEEAAQALGVSVSTVRADLRLAKAWLARELDRAEP
jgi:RNA polymerase sigma factor (TIGR02999 family)